MMGKAGWYKTETVRFFLNKAGRRIASCVFAGHKEQILSARLGTVAGDRALSAILIFA